MVNAVITYKAVREYRRNFTRRGMLVIVRRCGWRLLLHPRDELAKATALSEGVFT